MGVGALISALISGVVLAAMPASTNYKLENYGVNSGGTNSSASTTYSARGTAGEISGKNTASLTYNVNSGSVAATQASVPPAPTVDNGTGTYYNKLHFVINNSANPSDATFSVAVSTTSNFVVTNYVQADGTLGTGQLYRTYTAWGSAGGSYAVGLSPNTAYWFKVSAQEGKFTASAYGPSATASTVNPSLTFSVSPTPINMGNLNAGSIITSPTISFSFTTNGDGGFIYMSGSTAGLFSATNLYSIQVAPPSGDLTSLAEGAGVQATGDASLVAQSPYNLGGTTVGAISTIFKPVFIASAPVSSSSVTAVVVAKSKVTTPAGTDYTDTLTFVAAASF